MWASWAVAAARAVASRVSDWFCTSITVSVIAMRLAKSSGVVALSATDSWPIPWSW